MVYTDYRAWYSHYASTPFARQRDWKLRQGGTLQMETSGLEAGEYVSILESWLQQYQSRSLAAESNLEMLRQETAARLEDQAAAGPQVSASPGPAAQQHAVVPEN